MEQVSIRYLKGSKAGQTEFFPVETTAELLIGRDARASISFDARRDERVSRRHAVIRACPRRDRPFTIVDLESRNGTFVNGRRVQGERALRPNDVIELGAGGPRLLFGIETAEERPAAPSVAGALTSILSPLSLESLIKGFTGYWTTLLDVATRHRHYASDHADFSEPQALVRALSVYVFGATLTYVIALPMMLGRHATMDKAEFFVQLVYLQAVFILALHVAIRLSHGRGRVAQTAAAYLTWMGVALPFYMVSFHAKLYLGAVAAVVVGPLATHAGGAADAFWFYLPAAVVMGLTWAVPIHWLTQIHRIPSWRFALAFFIIAVPIVAAHQVLFGESMKGPLHTLTQLLNQLL